MNFSQCHKLFPFAYRGFFVHRVLFMHSYKKAITFLYYVSHTYFLSCFQYYIAFDSLLLRAAGSDKHFQLYCYFSVFYYRYVNIYIVLTQILNDNLTGKTKYKYNTNCFKQRRLSCLISKHNTCKSPPFFSDF